MIERLYLKELVGFDELTLEFDKGLVVFTGPSGAGKSVLMSALLSNFGYASTSQALLSTLEVKKPEALALESFVLEDEIIIKGIRKESLRFYLNEQGISKKLLKQSFAPYVQFLSVRDKSSFESSRLLSLLDEALEESSTFQENLQTFKEAFTLYQEKLTLFNQLQIDEQALVERMEFAKFEVEKITRINPKEGEELELLEVKARLSKVDKIKEVLVQCEPLFESETPLFELFRLLGKESSALSDLFGTVQEAIDDAKESTKELESLDVEEILNRISDITALQKRYGSIEEALAYKEEKLQELNAFEHNEESKEELAQFLETQRNTLEVLAKELSKQRVAQAKVLESKIAPFLAELKLPALSFSFDKVPLSATGVDSVDILLGGSTAHTLSGGEFNRVRLALLAASMAKSSSGVLLLDEIDANVSGDESIAIAKMIKTLSQRYQVFAVSHQPHLSAQASQHIVVTKVEQKSSAKVLEGEERTEEIARIVSGESPTKEALAFAKELRGGV